MNAEKMLLHVGHSIECVTYGLPPVNVSLECMTCNEVLHDEDLGRQAFPPIPEEQRTREAMGVYDPVSVYREMTDDEQAAEDLTWD